MLLKKIGVDRGQRLRAVYSSKRYNWREQGAREADLRWTQAIVASGFGKFHLEMQLCYSREKANYIYIN